MNHDLSAKAEQLLDIVKYRTQCLWAVGPCFPFSVFLLPVTWCCMCYCYDVWYQHRLQGWRGSAGLPANVSPISDDLASAEGAEDDRQNSNRAHTAGTLSITAPLPASMSRTLAIS